MTVCIKYCITLLLVSLLMAADEFVISLKNDPSALSFIVY